MLSKLSLSSPYGGTHKRPTHGPSNMIPPRLPILWRVPKNLNYCSQWQGSAHPCELCACAWPMDLQIHVSYVSAPDS